MERFLPFIFIFLRLFTSAIAHPTQYSDIFRINWKPEKVPSAVEFTYSGSSLDGPKVRPVNITTFDWWYFDAVSTDIAAGDLSSVVVVFYDATPGGFAALSNKTTKLEASITGSFKDGTPFGISTYPSEAVVITEGDSASGKWDDYASWHGSPDLRSWEIKFQDDENKVSGSMRLESVAPPHLPCGAPAAGETEELMPYIGWVNAVPDARATVDFEIAGTKLAFSGAGYHDKNWGAIPFFSEVRSWYWGHGHLGPYSIVWFDALSLQGEEYFSAYVAKDGQILSGSCEKDAVIVRPWGGEDTYPPPPNAKIPKGFEATFANIEGKQMKVNVTNADVVIPYGKVYDRIIGTLEGGFVGEEETWTGVAQYEQFKV